MFPMIIVAHLSRSVPRKALLEMLLTGDPIDAAEAHRLGFVNRIYPDRHALEEGLDDYAARFVRSSPQAIRLGRRAFSLLADLPAEQALDAAPFLNLPFFLGADLEEGANAFLERRQPHWASTHEPQGHAAMSAAFIVAAARSPVWPPWWRPRECPPGGSRGARDLRGPRPSRRRRRAPRRRPGLRQSGRRAISNIAGPQHCRPGCRSPFPASPSTGSAGRHSRPSTWPPRQWRAARPTSCSPAASR